MFTDDELFAFADETVNTFYAERMSYICGTHFTSSSNFENYIKNDDGIYYEVDDSQVQSYNDIENVYYQKFSRKYPICYDKPYNLSPLTKLPFTAVALASYPLSKKRFILMCLLPYILGIIPFICFIISPSNNLILNAILWGMAFLGMASPYPDAYNVYQVIKQVPKGKKVQFYEDDTYYI